MLFYMHMRCNMSFFDKLFMRRIVRDKEVTEDGGKGSGNFGHKGRPGLRGGSGKGGGKEYRTTSKETGSGYIGVQRAKAFKSISRNAKAYKGDYNGFVNSLSSEHKKAIQDQHKACGTQESLSDYTKRLHDLMANYEAKSKAPNTVNKPVDGKNLVTSFKRDKDNFVHEIEDVMHQQGFDGVPKVVSNAEFEKFKNANPNSPLFYRSYAAADADQLQDFDDMLEKGKWYVDCGQGGHQYGQGMYVIRADRADVDSGRIAGVMNEMSHYRRINEDRQRNMNVSALAPDGYAACKKGNQYGLIDKAEVSNFSQDKPAEGQIFGIRGWATYDTYVVKNGEVYSFNSDGTIASRPDSYYTNLMNNGSSYKYWAPIKEWKDLPKIDPVSSTREMMLDPSAKFVDYDKIDSEWKKFQNKALRDEMNKLKPEAQQALKNEDPTALKEKTFANILNGFQGKKELPSVGETKPIEDALKDLYNTNHGDWYGIHRLVAYSSLANHRSKNTSNLEDFLRDTAEKYYAHGADATKYGVPAYHQKALQTFLNMPSVQAAFDGIINRAKARADRTYRSAYVNDYINRHVKVPNFAYVYDPGSKAAAMGYDGINAWGHGQTGAYTVLLNRTKIILNEQRKKM